MMKEKTKVRSWELIDDKTLVKKTDKFFFKYAGATIPGPMHDFFDAESMRNGSAGKSGSATRAHCMMPISRRRACTSGVCVFSGAKS